MSSGYSWHALKEILSDQFQAEVSWNELTGNMIVRVLPNEVTIVKKNNIPREFIVEILTKLNISIDDFDKAYQKYSK